MSGRADDWKRKVATLVEVSSGYEKEKVEDIIVVAIGRVSNLAI